jgi:hypothetical protein
MAWPLFQIPLEQEVSRVSRLAFSAPLPAPDEEVEVSLQTTLEDAAARDFRWRLGYPGISKARHREVMAAWLDQWASLPFTGEPPAFDPRTPAGPLTFSLETRWRPEVQRIGEQTLLPVLLSADLFRNPFQQESRQQPIWLPGGHVEVSLTWELPPGAVPGPLPAAAGSEGPGGLAYTLEVAAEAPAEEDGASRVTTRLRLDTPYILPAADYAGVKRFFEELQRAAETRLLIGVGT